VKELLDVDTVVRATIAGHSIMSIASRHECSMEQVREALDEFSRKTPSPSNRSMVLALECSRLEMLEARFFKKAIEEGDSTAGTLVVKFRSDGQPYWASISRRRSEWTSRR